jgi:hypothetical protein
MPRTIWQYPGEQQTYIGHHVWTNTPAGMVVAPVWDEEVNDWIRLNSDTYIVDFYVHDVDYNQAVLKWAHDHDFVTIHITLDGPKGEKTFTTPGSNTQFTLTGLTAETNYTVNVYAKLSWDSWTRPNVQDFRTPRTPIPAAPGALRYNSRTNKGIALRWNSVPLGAQYEVYQAVGSGSLRRVKTVSGTDVHLSLKEDTKYRFGVRAKSADGFVGPMSNVLKSATGHDTVRRRGTVKRLLLPPKAWGSWRPDIKWKWWANQRENNLAVYQGYWNRTNTRYTGIIEYDSAALRRTIDTRLGADVAKHLVVTEASIRRLYRQREPGNVHSQEMVWHLTNSAVRGSLSGPSYFGSFGGRRIRAGTGIDFFALPASWGRAIISGKSGSSSVRGLVLHRSDHSNNGYGHAGYMKLSGHKQPDYHLGGGGNRMSDLSLVISGKWDFTVKSYKAPYNW